MRHVALITTLALATCAAAASPPAVARSERTPTFTNAEVVRVDTVGRLLVIRNTEGAEQTVELADTVAGFGDIKAGDRVILTLLGEPGRARVTSIAKATAESPSKAKTPVQRPIPRGGTSAEEAAREALATQVASLAPQANRVDALWNEFRTACDVKVSGQYGGAREWFSLWDGEARADLSSGFCRDLFNKIIGLGETVKSGMATAEEPARKVLEPGAIREVRRRYSLDWDGWGRPAPDRLDEK